MLANDTISLKELGGSLYGQMFSEIEITAPKDKISRPQLMNIQGYIITEFVEIPRPAVGKIIGHLGNTIREITEDNNVRISIGKFVETKNKGEKVVRETSGTLVTGMSQDIKQAKK